MINQRQKRPLTTSLFYRLSSVRWLGLSAGGLLSLVGGIGLLSGSVVAQTVPAASAMKPQSGYYRMKLGAVNVTALSDGTLGLPANGLLTNTTPAETDALLAQAHVPNPVETSVNSYLIELGKRVFPNATVHVRREETDYWLSEANLKQAPEAAKSYFTSARTALNPYIAAGKLHQFTGSPTLFPGLQAVASSGHTPGHAFYRLESQGETLVFWGDILAIGAVQFPNPTVASHFDVDEKMTVATRQQAYAEAGKQGYWVAVAHVSFPGIGHLRARGSGYDWLPINYSTTGTGQ